MFQLIKNSITKRSFQSFSLLLSVAVSIAVLFTLISVSRGVTDGLEKSWQRLGADMMVVPESAGDMLKDTDLLLTGAPAPLYITDDIIAKIEGIKGVSRVTAQFYGQTLSEPCCSTDSASRIIGFDSATDWVVTPWLTEEIGGPLEDDQIIVGSEVGGFESGSGYIRGNQFRVAGVLEPSGSGLDYSIFINIDILREMVGKSDDFAIYQRMFGPAESLVSSVLIEVEEGMENAVSSNLSSLDGVRVVKTAGVLDGVRDQMDVVFTVAASTGVLMAVAAVFQVFSRFWTMTWDRRSELGLYRALGASESDLKLLLLGEAALFTGGGAVTGSVLGFVLEKTLVSTLLKNAAFPFVAPSLGDHLLCALILTGLTLLVGLVAVLAPLSQTAKIDPAAAMQKHDID